MSDQKWHTPLAKLTIKQIQIGKRHRKDMGDLSELAASLETVGMLHPVVVDGKMNLISGARRIAAAKKLHWLAVPATLCRTLSDVNLALRAEQDENSCRKDFTPEEAVNIAAAIREQLEPIAQEREKSGKKLEPLANLAKGRVSETAANAVGMSRATLEKAEAVVAAAKDNPKLRPVVDKMNETGNVHGALKEVEKETEKEELTPLSKAVKVVEELASMIRKAQKFAREAFDFNDDKIAQAPYLCRFPYLAVIGELTSYLRMLEMNTPSGGTEKKPRIRLDDDMDKARSKK